MNVESSNNKKLQQLANSDLKASMDGGLRGTLLVFVVVI